MKRLGLSIMVCIFISAITYVLRGFEFTMKVNFGIGLVVLLLSMAMSGSLGSGDRQRANFYTTTEEDRETSGRWTIQLIVISIPFLSVAAILYYYGLKFVWI
ncbi:hypothetical protein BVG16_26795 [Paenibacillus selenitireducens]|uniref:DUF5316 domain-containing protein n=1 Tax=Paenibacillus selenitireducens TaxID=1324314 RepID=A0A1T2X1G2_9BACL|nr:DUF5316 family protein [Paenibacillus selenitireducens]OPA73704.1 hypothetical protein BVG16_26795 [Paenibacillus selenitireducens]